jgi:prophage regulatory protein
MSQRVIRLAQLASLKNRPGLLPVSQATIWRWVRQDKFPKPFKLAAGTTVWDAGAVEAFITAQQASGNQ